MIKWLDRGKWSRPTDSMAVYTEIEKGKAWGIRVTLIKDIARVEAINGEKCSWYKPGPEISTEIAPPNVIERLRGITFEDKLRREVEAKRQVAKAKNWALDGKGRLFPQQSENEE